MVGLSTTDQQLSKVKPEVATDEPHSTVNPDFPVESSTEPPPSGLTIDSMAVVDLRLLSQSDLYALSLSSSSASDWRRYDFDLSQIDLSLINEWDPNSLPTHSSHRRGFRQRNRLPGPRPRRSSASADLPADSNTPPVVEPFGPEDVDDEAMVVLLKKLFEEREAGNSSSDQSRRSQTVVSGNVEVKREASVATNELETLNLPCSGKRKRKNEVSGDCKALEIDDSLAVKMANDVKGSESPAASVGSCSIASSKTDDSINSSYAPERASSCCKTIGSFSFMSAIDSYG